MSGSVMFIKSNQEITSVPEEKSPGETKDGFNWRVILMPKFLIVGISICSYAFGVCAVYTCLPPLGKESGMKIKLFLGVYCI